MAAMRDKDTISVVPWLHRSSRSYLKRAYQQLFGIDGVAPFHKGVARLRSRAVIHDQGVTAKKLDARIAELLQCMKTDTVQSVRYDQGSRAYTTAEFGRMADFASRYNLLGQFYQEDDQGKR